MKVLALDIGGTNIKAGIIDGSGKVSDFFRYAVFNEDRTEKGIVKKLVRILLPLSKEKNIKGIGLGVPGFIDFKLDVVVSSPNFPEWNNFPLRKILMDILELPVIVENDANAFAIGEGWKGAGRDFNSFAGITLGTGVGGGIILDKKIWHGIKGSAGEIGHIIVEPEGLKCNCGSRGCLEMYASAQAVAREGRNLFRKKGISVSNSDMSLEIFKLAQKGNKEAIKIFSTIGDYLGIAIADLANTLNIDGVVLGGGLSNAWKFIYPAIKKEISYRINPVARRNVRIVKSKLGDYAALLGMAKLTGIK